MKTSVFPLEQGQQPDSNQFNIISWVAKKDKERGSTLYCFKNPMCYINEYSTILQSSDSVTLAVSNLRAVSGVGDEDPEEFSLTLNGFWALPHKRAVSWEGTLYGTSQINMKYTSLFHLHSFLKLCSGHNITLTLKI